MNQLPMLFAYLGPETMLPMTSIVAGAIGFLMMFGRNVWSMAKRVVRWATSRRSAGSNAVPAPHVRRIGSARTVRKTSER